MDMNNCKYSHFLLNHSQTVEIVLKIEIVKNIYIFVYTFRAQTSY